MKYINTKSIADKWNINDRRVRKLCEEGRIEGAIKIGRNWSIPVDAIKPIDARFNIYKKYTRLNYDFHEINLIKNKIDKYRPLSKNILNNLHEKLIAEWTYNSNAIEGNTLTLSETKVVLEGIAIGGKSVKEHLEIINHKEAILFIEELVEKEDLISEWEIKNINLLMVTGEPLDCYLISN